MKNILIINGSPKGKKSNTLKLTKAFVEGIQKVYEIQTEEITTVDADIRPCKGCFACWNKTNGKCVIPDDMKTVLEKILQADIIIWSFGLYYFNVPSTLKILIDRQLPLVMPFMDTNAESGGHPMRYDTTQKKHIIISTCGFYTAKGNYESVNTMFDHFLGTENYETVYCPQGELFRVKELSQRTDAYLEYVRKAGEEFAVGGITSPTREKLNELLFPKETFEAMADASWGIDRTTGQKETKAFSFTRQMASLYHKNSFQGNDIVLEMDYTDLGETYQIVLKKDGYEVLKENFLPFTTKIETPFTVWLDIAQGKISGEEAMMKKLYRVSGEFDLMIHWNSYFGGDNEAETVKDVSEKKSKNTNMMIMLIPWITLWTAVPIRTYIGSIITLLVCFVLPLIFIQHKKTVYDILSHSMVMTFALSVLIWNMPTAVLCLSYLFFGVMWLLSCLTKIPLTAHYSMNNYNGASALKNPLFMKTNLILTIMWGILYVITTIFTFFVMQTAFSAYLGIINSILPAIMGIFTVWFQKWYPAWYAKK